MEILSEHLNQSNYPISVVGTGKTLAVTHLSPIVAVNAWRTDDLPCVCSLPSSRETWAARDDRQCVLSLIFLHSRPRSSSSQTGEPQLCVMITDNCLSSYSAWPSTKHGDRRRRQPSLQWEFSFLCHVVRITRVTVSKLLVHRKGAVRISGGGTVNQAACMRCWKRSGGNWLLIKLTDFEKRNRINRVLHLKHDAVKYKWRRNARDAEQREVASRIWLY